MQEIKDLTPYRLSLRDRILDAAMILFAKHGIRAVKMDDVSHALSISKRTLYELYDNKEQVLLEGVKKYRKKRHEEFLQEVERTKDVMDIIERRITERIPAAYLTHEAWLQGYAFYVDRGVIVPRSFIAELIVDQFAPWVSDPDSIEDILELCTGSGCLAIMMADQFQNAHVDAVELSPAALAVA